MLSISAAFGPLGPLPFKDVDQELHLCQTIIKEAEKPRPGNADFWSPLATIGFCILFLRCFFPQSGYVVHQLFRERCALGSTLCHPERWFYRPMQTNLCGASLPVFVPREVSPFAITWKCCHLIWPMDSWVFASRGFAGTWKQTKSEMEKYANQRRPGTWCVLTPACWLPNCHQHFATLQLDHCSAMTNLIVFIRGRRVSHWPAS